MTTIVRDAQGRLVYRARLVRADGVVVRDYDLDRPVRAVVIPILASARVVSWKDYVAPPDVTFDAIKFRRTRDVVDGRRVFAEVAS